MTRENLLRVRHEGAHNRVTFVELFFDLIFVFAVTQLSHGLLEHFTMLGALQTALLLYAVWTVWIYTSWVTNWLDPEKVPVRIALFAMMLGGLIVSASIPEAFGERSLAFAGALVAIQIGRTIFFLYAVRNNANRFVNFTRVLAWLATSGVFWLAGGYFGGAAQLPLWLMAAAIDFTGPLAFFRTPALGRSTVDDWDIEGGHMAERCGLFIIIALGESILVTGATFADLAWTGPVIIGFVASFLASVAMWWIYFNVTAEAGSRVISAALDPGRIARSAYTYMHLPIVAGIIVTAAGDEFVLAHPTGHVSWETMIAVVGGPALFFAGIALFKMALGQMLNIPFFLAILAGFAIIVVAANTVDPATLSVLTTLALIAVCATDVMLARRSGDASAEHAAPHERNS